MQTENNTTSNIKKGFRKFFSWALVLILLFGGGFFYYKYYFVLGEGVKSGYLNYAVKKGYVFKTFEGKLIQEGFGSAKIGPGISSNEFGFSVENDSIFKILELNSGKFFDLHYKEYNGSLPWRGNTRYVVDQVIHIK